MVHGEALQHSQASKSQLHPTKKYNASTITEKRRKVTSQEFTPSPLNPGGHLQPCERSSWNPLENQWTKNHITTQKIILKMSARKQKDWGVPSNSRLTAQAENVVPSWVFFQHPPLLKSQRKEPGAVEQISRKTMCTQIETDIPKLESKLKLGLT